MAWTYNTTVGSLPAATELKFVCRGCDRQQTEITRYLVGQGRFGGLTLQRLEKVIRCNNPQCRGAVSIELPGGSLVGAGGPEATIAGDWRLAS